MYGGAIALDVCSSNWHQRTIRAKRHFTPKDNGLKQKWCNGSFGNIPYSNLAPWIKKGIAEEKSGVDGIIILVHSNTSTGLTRRNARNYWSGLADTHPATGM
jgi:hypothetical protein